MAWTVQFAQGDDDPENVGTVTATYDFGDGLPPFNFSRRVDITSDKEPLIADGRAAVEAMKPRRAYILAQIADTEAKLNAPAEA